MVPQRNWAVEMNCYDDFQLNNGNRTMEMLMPLQESQKAWVSEYHVQDVCTHLPLDKMAAILADDNFKWIFLNENDRILIRISLKFVPRSPIDNEPILVQVMAWRRTGDKSLPELMLT